MKRAVGNVVDLKRGNTTYIQQRYPPKTTGGVSDKKSKKSACAVYRVFALIDALTWHRLMRKLIDADSASLPTVST